MDVAVVDGGGGLVASFGDVDRATQPRSAIKAIQAVPLITSGAADDAGLTEVELALACSSHNGEVGHVAAVESWLDSIGASPDDLECGAHVPYYRPAADAMVIAGESPTPAHNNCSGKHTGFVHTSVHLGEEPSGYLAPSHPQQVRVTRSSSRFTGIDVAGQVPGVDGCGIPVFTFPLRALAMGWARLATGEGVDADAATAGSRLLDAMTHQPWFVAGTDRHCTSVMYSHGGRIAAKTGAEGVFCAVDRESGRGVALKADDGASRASEHAIDWILARLVKAEPPAPTILRNWAGTEVGQIRVKPV